MIGTGTAVNKTARDYAKSLGLPTDDAGHILAKILGGQGGKGKAKYVKGRKSLSTR